MKISPKWFSLLPMAFALMACADSSSGGGGGGGGSPPGPAPGKFSVALASAVSGSTEGILAPGATAATNKIFGLAVDVAAAKAGKAADPANASPTALEVWLTDTTYFDTDGAAKNDDSTSPAPWKVVWDAYDPTAATTSVKAAYAADKVTIGTSATNKPSRMKVQVGNTLLAKDGGAVVVVYIYPSTVDVTTTPADVGVAADAATVAKRKATYTLTITQAAAPALTTAVKVSAKGLAKASTAPTQSALNGETALAATAVTVDTTDAFKATVTLPNLTTAPTNGQKVAFNTFTVTGAAAGINWKKLAGSTASGDFLAVNVIASGDTAASTATAVDLTDTARADYTAASTKKGGKVTLTGEDAYGQQVEITVTLEDRAVT